MQFFNALVYFLITIGILVTIHEFGHYWVAKKLGIKVLRFSIGFGKVLFAWRRGETQYTLCALPLGGFVKMLDENEGEVAAEERHRAFSAQSVYRRFAVVAAGPIANFLLAIVLYTAIFVVGVQGIKPIVGSVENTSIAQQAGLQVGDQLLSVNSKSTIDIGEFSMGFIQASESPTLKLKVRSKTDDLKTLILNLEQSFLSNPERSVEQYLGFTFEMPSLKPIINQVVNASPANLAGIQSGDEILQANGKVIKTWQAFVKAIQNNANQTIRLNVLRGQRVIALELIPKDVKGVAKVGVSVIVPEGYLDEWQVLVKKDLFDAFLSANVKVYELTKLNLKMIKKMILGETSVNQISGPLSIANYAGKTAQVGIISFLSFLALISIGLGLLNLLPIPLLDGGHLLFYFIEMVKGSPVGQITQQTFTLFGFFIIALLTIIALYNDSIRLL